MTIIAHTDLEQWALNDRSKELMFHSTAEKCCQSHFFNTECNIVKSNCKVSEEFAEALSCTTPGWFMSMDRTDGCSNKDDYPEEWLEPSMVNTVFFPTSKACCDEFFKGRTCVLYDDGCTIERPAPDCEDEWHPDAVTRVGCSNDSAYPDTWKKDTSGDTFFYPTAQACCNEHHSVDMTCQVRDACEFDEISLVEVTREPTSSPTMPCAWHISLEVDDRCEFSSGYPSEWNDPDNIRGNLFNSHEGCCRHHFDNAECGAAMIGGCQTPAPTRRPTKKPVYEPSSSPVPPTPYPSASPTSSKP